MRDLRRALEREPEGRSAKLLTEKEIGERERRRAFRPYKRGAGRLGRGVVGVGKGIGKVAYGFAKVPIDLIKYFGEESRKNAGLPLRGSGIDIGLRSKRDSHPRPVRIVRPSSSRRRSTLSPAQAAKADRMGRARQSRNR